MKGETKMRSMYGTWRKVRTCTLNLKSTYQIPQCTIQKKSRKNFQVFHMCGATFFKSDILFLETPAITLLR